MSKIICDSTTGISDEFGDSGATFTCQLEKGHEGLHSYTFNSNECWATDDKNMVTVTWEKGEKEPINFREGI